MYSFDSDAYTCVDCDPCQTFLTSALSVTASPLLDFAWIAPLLGVSFGSANSPSLLAVRPDQHRQDRGRVEKVELTDKVGFCCRTGHSII